MTATSPQRPRARRWSPGRPVDIAATWGTLRRGAGDPTWISADGVLWRGVRTPLGPVTLRVATRPAEGQVVSHAWGGSAATEWILDHLPRMLGQDDDATLFVPRHEAVAVALQRRGQGWRVPRTGLVLESLVPAVIEQKVTGQEAFGGYRRIVRRLGELAPGPGEELGLFVVPAPERLRQVPSWEWLRMGVSPQRADTLMRVLRVADRLEQVADLPLPQAHRRMRALPGVGVWTAAETAQRALGDADAVSFGDYHVAKNIGWALTGQEVDDDALAALLEPYRGHRYRVQRLLELAGAMRPRRGPRMAPRGHLPIR
ncbi:DNA-3-methyladenine glycosylase family protein [Ornithinimicrobium faecis]|uniref:DNA-3-methyladenine glycosylase 2 family protein n=1 Tax=Ornithinimicrobium faecis TaxID=2934158 RepID=A0ABY4YQ52_9MICO|nr:MULTISPECIES: DNA-3-methyladenine glycosylase 2 family protein [unclassified Ornithinimicrobium]USQ78737.1 DNA-3-methyladenine glycosylase 2 family protein [Ornithinimicrobium sp. HY1793]